MKFNNIKACLAVAALITANVSCKKDFLEVVPKGRLIMTTTNDYYLGLNSTYYLNIFWSIDPLGQVPLGDEVASVEPHFTGTNLRAQRLFRYEADIYEQNEEPVELPVPMRNIYLYNKVINEVMSSTGGTEAEKKSILAEARVGRAWTYFLLINYYGKPFNESTASTDPGFPLITESDVTKSNFKRASVKEVYDFILNDLNSAMPDLPGTVTHRLRPSKAAGAGLLGKVYVFMGKYGAAIPHLNAALENLASAAIPVGLNDYNQAFAPGGSFLPISIVGPTYPASTNNIENVYAKQFINGWTYTNNEFVITKATADLFGPTDLRRNFYKNTPFPSGAAYPNGMLRRISPNGTQFGVMVPELYLLRAESKARQNDLTGAKADVEALRVKRMAPADAPVPEPIASDQISLVRFIIEERIREYAMQGFRWFDMRRLSIDPLFAGLSFSHALYSATGDVLFTYKLTPERLTLRLPTKVLNQNPEMENNP